MFSLPGLASSSLQPAFLTRGTLSTWGDLPLPLPPSLSFPLPLSPTLSPSPSAQASFSPTSIAQTCSSRAGALPPATLHLDRTGQACGRWVKVLDVAHSSEVRGGL